MAISTASNVDRLSSLRGISGTAQRIKELLDYRPSVPIRPNASITLDIPQLDLPSPAVLLRSLQTIDFPDHIREKSTSRFLEWITTTQQIHSRHYMESCHQLLSTASIPGLPYSLLVEKLLHVYKTSYAQNFIPLVEAQIKAVQRSACTTPHRCNGGRKRPAFHTVGLIHSFLGFSLLVSPQEYTPFLEKYFEYNAYPSGPDRAVLARKSMMTSRQIEVWVSAVARSISHCLTSLSMDV